MPGVVVAPAGITSRGEDTFFNANGNFATWNNYTLDGADNNSFSTNLQERSPQVVQPPVDALQEFKVQTRTYSAEFGKAGGAVINASIKQGTNAFRGSVYGFFRDEAFNANTWDNNRAGRPKGQFNQHIAGVTLGGPMMRGRTFFFGDYQATRTERALSQTATVPTALMRTGDLSELTGTMNASQPVRAGRLRRRGGQARQPPRASTRSRRSSSTLYPLPNVPGAGFFNNNFISNGILDSDIDQFDVRVDHTCRSTGTTSSRVTASSRPTAASRRCSRIRCFGRLLQRQLHPRPERRRRLVAHLRQRPLQRVPRSPTTASGPTRCIRRSASTPTRSSASRACPRIRASTAGCRTCRSRAFSRIGGPFFRPQFQTSQVYQFAENLTWSKGSHTFKFGIELRRDLVTTSICGRSTASWVSRTAATAASASATCCSACEQCSG